MTVEAVMCQTCGQHEAAATFYLWKVCPKCSGLLKAADRGVDEEEAREAASEPAEAPEAARGPGTDWMTFRRKVIDKLVTGDALGYITKNDFAGKCPVCGEDVVFHFHGRSARVSIRCLEGCTEQQIVEEMRAR